MIEYVLEVLSYGFIMRALIVGILISLCSALLGVSLVLKRYSMIGDGLSHVALGSLAVASAAGIAPLKIALPVVIIAAFLLLRISENSAIKGDSAIALISTGALAVGIFVISMTSGMNIDVSNYLFGSILAVSSSDAWLSAGLALAVIVLYIFFYHRIFAITFDENFAAATGTNVKLYKSAIAVLTAVTVVIGMQLMGALLMSSFIIFPSLTSMRLCKSFKHVIICSAVVSAFSVISGILMSCFADTPTGAGIVIINICIFAVFSIISFCKKFSRS
ncbi:MAG: metal ABC transporter permease [Ruminococcaceae bacterium]|nr:metal ABC transporter permease [Oscillospiraceae bacterium]